MFWGILAALVFGVFHETFKESQGAVLLAFLVWVSASLTSSKSSVRKSK